MSWFHRDANCTPSPALARLIRIAHAKWLLETGQEEKAGALKEADGDYSGALNMYLKAGLATRASRLVQTREELLSDPDIVSRITSALLKGEFFEQAGELFEKVGGKEDQALDCFRKGKTYARAVELARREFPSEVVNLEEEWGDHLANNKQMDAASSLPKFVLPQIQCSSMSPSSSL